MAKESITIKLPYELAGKLSKKIGEAGFDTITSYVVYVLEQVLAETSGQEDSSEDDDKEVRERLKKLGYL